MISISLLCSPHPKVALSINVLHAIHAIHWIAQVWKEVEPETITKHFQKAEMQMDVRFIDDIHPSADIEGSEGLAELIPKWPLVRIVVQ